MSDLGFYYIVGYYTIEETLDKSFEIAKIIQTRFSSWDEPVESYPTGHASWSGTNASDRGYIHEQLRTSAFNPFSPDQNMPLEEGW